MVELFLLACALYAHDWGMAVGAKEQVYLRRGARIEDIDDCFTPLPDEPERLAAFVRSEGIRRSTDTEFPELSDDQLRLYVRLTHACRSGARARSHFHEYPAVGEALAHLCEGHWQDFETLDDPRRFPHEYEVAGDTAHLLALALQVRLIDLFHITDDRTPYALWRFVSPKDRRSKEEWNKHHALHGVACIDYPPGRAIKVQGFTEDEEVWAGLQDLSRYCEEQITKTLALSARHVPQRYILDFLKLEWAVQTGSLKPMDLSFGFNSNAMFRILSDDIYDGDPYIFLRELLQNAIDAIRTRRALYLQQMRQNVRRRQSGLPFDTTIYFAVEHSANGDFSVSCRDYGIGMDEHVIKNYFTVAGVSYYRSKEFEYQNLGFEPVSRFGVGILSCFMVAESLEVRTYRDPDYGPAMAHSDLELPGADSHRARRLHLTVPGVDRQFIVKGMHESFQVGTEITLKGLSSKLASRNDVNEISKGSLEESTVYARRLKITEYLSLIAGFVEFPILIEESWPGQEAPSLTLILHPDCDAEKELEGFDTRPEVHQLSRKYPWAEVAAEESVDTASQVMTSYSFELREFLGNKGYEGWVTYPAPMNMDISTDEIGSRYRPGMEADKTIMREYAAGEFIETTIYWLKNSDHTFGVVKNPRLFAIYRDGILLQNINDSLLMEAYRLAWEYPNNRNLPCPQILINLPPTQSPGPNLSRMQLAHGSDACDALVIDAIRDWLARNMVAKALELPPDERLYRLGELSLVFNLSLRDIDAMVPKYKQFRVMLVPPGKLEFQEGVGVGRTVAVCPIILTDNVIIPMALEHKFPTGKELNINWEGEPSLVEVTSSWPFHQAMSIQLHRGYVIASSWTPLITKYTQFLEPPNKWYNHNMFSQDVSIIDETDEYKDYLDHWDELIKFHRETIRNQSINEALQAAIADPSCLPVPTQMRDVSSAIYSPIPIPFAEPFNEHFLLISNGNQVKINSKHEVGASLVRCLAACTLAIRENKMTQGMIHKYRNITENIFHPKRGITSIANLFSFVEEQGLIEGFTPPLLPDLPNYFSQELEELKSPVFSS